MERHDATGTPHLALGGGRARGFSARGTMLRLELGDYAGPKPYAAGLVRIRTGSEVPLHTHRDFAELVYIVDGRGEHRVGAELQSLRPGHAIFVRPQDQHAYRSLPDHSLTVINVAFPVRSLTSFFDSCGVDPVPWMRSASPPIVEVGDAHGAKNRLAKQFERTLEAFYRNARGIDLIALLSMAFGEFEQAWHAPDENRTAPDWLRAAVLAMSAEHNLRDGIPRMVDLAGVSHGHLAREVRKHYGCTCSQLVTAKRLDLARVLLATSTDSVSLIAHRCGFSSAAYFIRLFRERFATTPAASRPATSSLGPVALQAQRSPAASPF